MMKIYLGIKNVQLHILQARQIRILQTFDLFGGLIRKEESLRQGQPSSWKQGIDLQKKVNAV